ncbi:HAD-IA family hydrolase [Streptomyces sp. NPDC092296]|uniref:HAD-IA family hydrolase n=1 Tax=Streptomyces sp. NPDC092296 TaxID=3366012 RepID=UPI00382D2376
MSHRTGLILDFDGVLTTSVAAGVAAYERREGLRKGAFSAVITRDPEGAALYRELERGAISQREWNERTAAILGVGPANLCGRVLADLAPEPSVIAAVQAARLAGVKVGIFANGIGTEPFDPYEGYDFNRLYDAVLISEHYGMRKPDPALYRIMLDLMDLPGECCVFVDDTAHHLPPAAELGVATVHATDPAGTIAQLEALLGVPLGVEV